MESTSPIRRPSERELESDSESNAKPDDAVAALNGRALGVEPGWYAYIVSKGAHSVYRWDDFRTKYRRVASSISRCDGTLLSIDTRSGSMSVCSAARFIIPG